MEADRPHEQRMEFEVTKRVIDTCSFTLQLEKASILDLSGGSEKLQFSSFSHERIRLWQIELSDCLGEAEPPGDIE
jgi:hypothetical protein